VVAPTRLVQELEEYNRLPLHLFKLERTPDKLTEMIAPTRLGQEHCALISFVLRTKNANKFGQGRALNIALERAFRAVLMVEGLPAEAHVFHVMFVSLGTRFSKQKVKGHAQNITKAHTGKMM
jgi:hypothetical protein